MSISKSESDEVLIKRVAVKNESAFKELFSRYEQKIFNLVYRYIGSYSEAEELTQDVFIQVYKSANKFRGEAKFSSWLYRITVNICKNYKRRKQPVVKSLDNSNSETELLAHATTQPETIFKRKRKEEIINQAIESLPPNQRIAFILCKYEGHSYKEIAGIMKISVSAVESLLFRAKQQLKEKLMPYIEKGKI